jgi:hypothetical protein
MSQMLLSFTGVAASGIVAAHWLPRAVVAQVVLPPGTEQAIAAAVATNRYEAVALVVVMISCLVFIVWLVKATFQQSHEREQKLTLRIDNLEDYSRTVLKEVADKSNAAMLQLSNSVAENTRVVAELIATLHSSRPCFAVGEQQDKLISLIADRVVERILLKTSDGG